jgi:hypothetical protein
MPVDWNTELVEQLDWHWRNQLRPRLDGLTDAEYLWEPVPGCWSVRPRGQAVTTMAAGGGDHVVDFELPEPAVPPVTTIAWRLCHIGVGIFGMRASSHFGGGSLSYETAHWPATAAGGLALVDDSYATWTAGLRSLDAEGLARPCGPAEGPYAEHPFAALILHINREAIHHGAEVALLRDLWANGAGAAGTLPGAT